MALGLARYRKLGTDTTAVEEHGLREVKEEGEGLDVPLTLGILGWATTNTALEVLFDAVGGACVPTLHQGAVSTGSGALLPSLSGPAKLTQLLNKTVATKCVRTAVVTAIATAVTARGTGGKPNEAVPWAPLVVLLDANGVREGGGGAGNIWDTAGQSLATGTWRRR